VRKAGKSEACMREADLLGFFSQHFGRNLDQSSILLIAS
jgi:hypothetical protein